MGLRSAGRFLVIFHGENRHRISVSTEAWRELSPSVKCLVVGSRALFSVATLRPRLALRPFKLSPDRMKSFQWTALCDAGSLPFELVYGLPENMEEFRELSMTGPGDLAWPPVGRSFRTISEVWALPRVRHRYYLGTAELLGPYLNEINSGADIRPKLGHCRHAPGIALDPFSRAPGRAFLTELHRHTTESWWDPKPAVWEVGRSVLRLARQHRYRDALKNGVLGVPEVIRSRRERIRSDMLDDLDAQISVTYVLDRLVIAGGVLSVIQLVNELVLRGVDARIATLFEDPAIYGWQPMLSRPMVFRSERELIDNLPATDIAVATLWKTAPWVAALKDQGKAAKAAYFIQDFESWFYPEGDRRRNSVLETYSLIENRIVKTRWLQKKLESLGHRAERIALGINLDIFYPRGSREKEGAPTDLGAGQRSANAGLSGQNSNSSAVETQHQGQLDLDPDAPSPRSGEDRGDGRILMAMARPGTPNRGYDTLIQVLERLNVRWHGLHVVLFGTRELHGLPSGMHIENLGVVQDLDLLAERYSRADVFLDTSRFQGFGRCGLEAMACGTSCVLSSGGGVSEYAEDGKNCVLVDPTDIEGYIQSVITLLQDSGERNRLVPAALRSAERYSLHLEADRTIQYFSQLCGERSQ